MQASTVHVSFRLWLQSEDVAVGVTDDFGTSISIRVVVQYLRAGKLFANVGSLAFHENSQTVAGERS